MNLKMGDFVRSRVTNVGYIVQRDTEDEVVMIPLSEVIASFPNDPCFDVQFEKMGRLVGDIE